MQIPLTRLSVGTFYPSPGCSYLRMNDTRTYAKQIKLNCDENVSNTGYSVALVLDTSYLMLQLVSGLE